MGGGPINFEGGASCWYPLLGGGVPYLGGVPNIAIPYMECVCGGGSYFGGGPINLWGSIWGYRGIYGLQLHGVTTGWRCEVSMGVMGWFYGVIGGSMGCNYTV